MRQDGLKLAHPAEKNGGAGGCINSLRDRRAERLLRLNLQATTGMKLKFDTHDMSNKKRAGRKPGNKGVG